MKVTLQTCVPEIFASVDVGPSGGSGVRRPGSEDPHALAEFFFFSLLIFFNNFTFGWVIFHPIPTDVYKA